MLKRSGSLAIAIILLVSLAAGSAYAQTGNCQGAKMKAAGKKAGCLLKVDTKAAAKSIPVDTTKLAACKTKFSAGFTKAETAADCGPATGDTAVIQAKLVALEDDVACELDAGPACACGTPDPASLSFTTALGSGNCGSTVNDLGSPITSLACNNL